MTSVVKPDDGAAGLLDPANPKTLQMLQEAAVRGLVAPRFDEASGKTFWVARVPLAVVGGRIVEA
jgi:hypothetical protein